MRKLRATWSFFSTLNRDAALDSLRNVLALIGAGTILADFSTMRLWFVLPGAALAFCVWYFDYLRHDFPEPVNKTEHLRDKYFGTGKYEVRP